MEKTNLTLEAFLLISQKLSNQELLTFPRTRPFKIMLKNRGIEIVHSKGEVSVGQKVINKFCQIYNENNQSLTPSLYHDAVGVSSYLTAIMRAHLDVNSHSQKKQKPINYWWVSQNQTYIHEVEGGYLWSPKINKNGSFNQAYENMLKIEPGDVIYSFFNSKINAIGIAQKRAVSQSKPVEFGEIGNAWDDEGWMVEVEFHMLDRPLQPSEHMDKLSPLLPDKYSPIQSNGRGNQVYLCYVPNSMAIEMNLLLKGQVEEVQVSATDADITIQESREVKEVERISRDNNLTQTEKDRLIKARTKQGVFRKRVILKESCCRVTGVKAKSHLVASHIKPWVDSTDFERLDGNNGLLLSPHVDHLFDRGFISFADNGAMLVSNKLMPAILELWSIDSNKSYGKFNVHQRKYMQFHRDKKFKR